MCYGMGGESNEGRPPSRFGDRASLVGPKGWGIKAFLPRALARDQEFEASVPYPTRVPAPGQMPREEGLHPPCLGTQWGMHWPRGVTREP